MNVENNLNSIQSDLSLFLSHARYRIIDITKSNLRKIYDHLHEIAHKISSAVKTAFHHLRSKKAPPPLVVDIECSKSCEQDTEICKRLIGQAVSRSEITLFQPLNALAVKETLRGLYGENAVARALAYYGLVEHHFLYPQDILSLLCGIVANLTFDDVKWIYENQMKKEINDSNEKELCDFVEMLRQKVPLIPFPKTSYGDQLDHDQNLLRYLNSFGEFHSSVESDIPIKDIKKFSYTEYIARVISYALFYRENVQFPNGILIPLHENGRGYVLKEAHRLVSEKGLHGFLLKQVRPDASHEAVQVAFRGTYCKKSALRNLNPFESSRGGPGRISYAANKDVINNQIRFVLNSLNGKKVALEFIGHSLGATDAQRALEYFLETLVKDRRGFTGALKLYAYNSPGIEPEYARRFVRNAEKAEGVPLILRYFDVQNDPVQELGTKRIGYCGQDSERPKNLTVSIFRFNRNLIEKVKAIAGGILRRALFTVNVALEAHTGYCLRLHDCQDNTQFNGTYCEEIVTDNTRDRRLRYGVSRSQFARSGHLDSYLITTACRELRKVYRWVNEITPYIIF